MPEKLKNHVDDLMNAFEFDEPDLELNRHGELSAQQTSLLQRRRTRNLSLVSIGSILFLAIGLYQAAFGQLSPDDTAALFVILAVFLGIGLFRLLQLAPAVGKSLQMIEGRVPLGSRGGRSRHRSGYRASVDDWPFRISRQEFFAFKNGDPYRVYYIPGRNTIVSVEWLRDDDPFEEPNDNHRLEYLSVSEEDLLTPETQSLPLRRKPR